MTILFVCLLLFFEKGSRELRYAVLMLSLSLSSVRLRDFHCPFFIRLFLFVPLLVFLFLLLLFSFSFLRLSFLA